MTDWIIELANPHDSHALADLAALTFPLACPSYATEEEINAHISSHLTQESFNEWLSDPESFIHVARTPRGLIGYCLVCLHVEEETEEVRQKLRFWPTCCLSKCYVLPSNQGTGVAGSLVSVAIAHAKRMGMRGMWLGTNVENARALAFYDRCGFERVGERHYNVGGRIHDDYVLEMELRTD